MIAIYCRISQEKEEGKDKSIKEQRLRGIGLAKKLGKEYVVYIDEGISGTYEIKDRPQFSKMLDDVQDGKLSAIYAYDQSRLERSPQVRFAFIQLLKDNNVRLFTDTEEIDLNNDEQEMLGDMVSVFNQYYVRITKKKVKGVIHRNVSEGKVHGVIPYGYMKGDDSMMVIDPEEAKVVKSIFKMSLDGLGYNSIALALDKLDVPTRYNKIGASSDKKSNKTINQYTGEKSIKDRSKVAWSKATVRGIMKNEVYYGKRVFGGVEYKCPSIISKSHFIKVQDNLNKNRIKTGKKVKHKYLLNELVICGKCGKRMTGSAHSNNNHIYKCVSARNKDIRCGNMAIKRVVLDKLIWDRLFIGKAMKDKVSKYFNESKITENTLELQKELKSTLLLIQNFKTKTTNAVELAIEGVLSKEDIKPTITKYKKSINDLEIKAANLKGDIAYIEVKRKRAESLGVELKDVKVNTPFNERQSIIHKYIKSIQIIYKEGHYHLLIKYHLDIPDEEWVINRFYDVAIEQRGSIVIPLSEKYKMKLFNESAFKWLDSKLHDSLVSKAIRTSLEFDADSFSGLQQVFSDMINTSLSKEDKDNLFRIK